VKIIDPLGLLPEDKIKKKKKIQLSLKIIHQKIEGSMKNVGALTHHIQCHT
jgi:hypothetical protein